MDDPTTRTGFKRNLKQLYDASQQEAANLHDYIETTQKSLDADLKSTQQAIADVGMVKDEADKKLALVSTQATEVKRAYDNFKDLTKNVNSKTSGVAAKLKKIDETLVNAATVKQAIDDNRDEVLVVSKEVSNLKNSASEKATELDKLLADSGEIRDKIQETYKVATDLGLAGALFNRKKQLSNMVAIWLAIFLLSAITTVGIIVFVIQHLSGETAINMYLSRVLFVTPTFFLSIFSYTQYNNERKLLERYSFRAAMAQSLESYTSLLSRVFAGDKYRADILDFTLCSMRDIYDKSSIDITSSLTRFSIKSHLASVEATIKEEANNINKNVKDVAQKIDNLESDAEESMTAESAQSQPKVTASIK